MVDNVLIAYVKTDQKDARMIAQMDDRTNEYFDSIYKHAVEAMKANPETVISGTDYLHVAQYLERIMTMSQIFVSGLFTWQLVKLPN